MTRTYACVVTATDSGKLTCTTSVVININDANDNAPSFFLSQETYLVSPSVKVGTVLGTIPVYDPDVSSYGTTYYNLDMSQYTRYYIDINSTGSVYVRESLTDFSIGDKMDLNLTVVDAGGLTTSILVSIVFNEVKCVRQNLFNIFHDSAYVFLEIYLFNMLSLFYFLLM